MAREVSVGVTGDLLDGAGIVVSVVSSRGGNYRHCDQVLLSVEEAKKVAADILLLTGLQSRPYSEFREDVERSMKETQE